MKRIILFILFISSMVSFSYTGEIKRMRFVLIPIGKVDKQIFERLKIELSKLFDSEVDIGKDMPEPDYAFNSRRRQYSSSAILERILKEKEYSFGRKRFSYDRILAVIDRDLYVPDLNFVFGEAKSKAALISITRLRQSYYGLSEDTDIFYKRVLTETVHELGHTYGLRHCPDSSCVMFFSNSLIDTDRKGHAFCARCRIKLIRD